MHPKGKWGGGAIELQTLVLLKNGTYGYVDIIDFLDEPILKKISWLTKLLRGKPNSLGDNLGEK